MTGTVPGLRIGANTFQVFASKTSQVPVATYVVERGTGQEVLLRSGPFVPKSDIQEYLSSGEQRGVLQFSELPTQERHAELQAAGITLHDYLPNLAYVASIDATLTAQDLAQLGVRAWFPLKPDDRLSADLRSGDIGPWATPTTGKVDVIIMRYPDFPEAEAMSAVSALGGTVLGTAAPFGQLTARMSVNVVRTLAEHSWVLWIETIPPPSVVHNDGSRQSINVDAVQALPYNLTGAGVRVAVFDVGAIDAHPDLAGRVTLIDPTLAAHEHATHVAGTLAGDGTLSGGTLRGMAPKASLYSGSMQAADGYRQLIVWTTHATVISQNSWGAYTNNAYNNSCALLGDYFIGSIEIDQLVRVNNFATYRSAGNTRTSCAPLIYGTIDPYATAKNAVTVGAVSKTGIGVAPTVASFSGWGPTDDGRLKPDVVAVGVNVQSTCLSSTYCTASGTSMSTPAISGTAALLMEYYRKLNVGRDPSPALVKAILLNTAKDLFSKGPDFQTGYGEVDALRTADTVRDSRFFTDEIGLLQNKEYWFNAVTGPQCSFKVLLAYTDREGAPNAAAALVNNLDINLVDPNGSVYLPLTLDPSNPTTDAVQGVNTRDNVEQVVVGDTFTPPPLLSGIWKAVVTGTKVPYGPQPFAVTWEARGPGCAVNFLFCPLCT